MNEMRAFPVVAGAFGGGGGSGGPTEQPDNLASTQVAQVLLAVSEGPIYGPINSLQGVYLNGTPVVSAKGDSNFPNIWFDMTLGTADNEGKVFGQGGSASREIQAGVRVFHDDPSSAIDRSFIRTINDPNVGTVGITVSVPRLMSTNDKGDINGAEVVYQIMRRPFGAAGWQVITTSAGFSAMAVVGQTVAQTFEGQQSERVRVKWRLDTPDGPGGGAPPSALVQYREVGASSWIDIEQATFHHNEGRTRAHYWTEFDPPAAARYELRAVGPNGNARVMSAESASTQPTFRIAGKASSEYRQTRYVQLSTTYGHPWDIRVLRVTADATDNKTFNELWVSSYTEIIPRVLRYPFTALAWLQFDARTFSSPPKVGIHGKGRIIRVPSNYDANSATYNESNGPWDGTFHEMVSDCPPWVWFDMVTHDRYGLGEFVADEMVDIYELYEIGKWCDQRVPTGVAGRVERRWTCRAYLQTRTDAYRMLQNLASVFRGQTFYGAGKIGAVADRPQPIAFLFNQTNVVDGEFAYEGVGYDQMHTVAMVAWNNPANMYEREVLTVVDDEGVRRFGWIPTEVIGVGCCSESMARRIGRSILTTERLEGELVRFRTGLEAAHVMPGDVYAVQDASRAGKRMGGRVVGSTASTVTIDRPVTIQGGLTYTLRLVRPDGVVEQRDLIDSPGETDVLHCAVDLATVDGERMVADAVWILEASNLEPTLWRCLAVREVGEMAPTSGPIVELTGVRHRPEKYAEIDGGARVVMNPHVSVINPREQSAITNLQCEESLYLEYQAVKVIVTLTWAAAAGAARYWVRWRRDGGRWSGADESQDTEWDLRDAAPGAYEFSVQAESPFGKRSAAKTLQRRILGKTARPPTPDYIRVFSLPDGRRRIEFGMADEPLDLVGYVIHYGVGDVLQWVDTKPLHSGVLRSSPWEFSSLPAGQYTFAVRAKDSSGLLSEKARAVKATLGLPKGGEILFQRDSFATQWPGRTTRIDVATGYLLGVPLSSEDWSTVPASWADWDTWADYDDRWDQVPDTWASWSRWAS